MSKLFVKLSQPNPVTIFVATMLLDLKVALTTLVKAAVAINSINNRRRHKQTEFMVPVVTLLAMLLWIAIVAYLLNVYRLTTVIPSEHNKMYFQIKCVLLVVIIPATVFTLVSDFSLNSHLLVIVPIQALVLYYTKSLLDVCEGRKDDVVEDVKVCIVEEIREVKESKNKDDHVAQQSSTHNDKNQDVVVKS